MTPEQRRKGFEAWKGEQAAFSGVPTATVVPKRARLATETIAPREPRLVIGPSAAAGSPVLDAEIERLLDAPVSEGPAPEILTEWAKRRGCRVAAVYEPGCIDMLVHGRGWGETLRALREQEKSKEWRRRVFAS